MKKSFITTILPALWGVDSKVWISGLPGAVWHANGEIVRVKEPLADFTGQYSVYPNPAKDVLFISESEPKGENTFFELTDALGRPVRKGILSPSQQIDLSGLHRGVYFLTLRNRNGAGVKKVVKE